MTIPEEWRVIADFPNYAVSSHGRVKRIVPDQKGRLSGRPLKTTASSGRYLTVTLCSGSARKNARINRVVCEAFHGPPPSATHHAAHCDGDRYNNAAANLCWKLPVENEADKRIHGTALIGDNHWSRKKPERRSRGEEHGRSKLTVDDVRKIRTDSRYQRTIADEYGVSQRAIWMIKNRITWRHVA